MQRAQDAAFRSRRFAGPDRQERNRDLRTTLTEELNFSVRRDDRAEMDEGLFVRTDTGAKQTSRSARSARNECSRSTRQIAKTGRPVGQQAGRQLRPEFSPGTPIARASSSPIETAMEHLACRRQNRRRPIAAVAQSRSLRWSCDQVKTTHGVWCVVFGYTGVGHKLLISLTFVCAAGGRT